MSQGKGKSRARPMGRRGLDEAPVGIPRREQKGIMRKPFVFKEFQVGNRHTWNKA